MLDLNFSDAVNPNVAEGTHEFEIVSAETKQSGNKRPMLAVSCVVISEGDEQGKKITANHMIDQEGLFYAKPFFEALGYDTEGDLSLDLEDLKGATFTGTVAEKEGGYRNIVAYGEE